MAAKSKQILVVRLGAIGDIVHALPAVTSLKLSFPDQPLCWLVARKWLALLEGNPYIDSVIAFDRQSFADVAATWKQLRALRPGLAVDFQGLVQSAVAGRVAAPERFVGLSKTFAREPAAAIFYTDAIAAPGPHRVERCLQLAQAAGATHLTEEAWLPQGVEEADLPKQPFVLANPFAGWMSKQWPLEYYEKLGALLQKRGLLLVLNVPHSRRKEIAGQHLHSSSIAGLIFATRRATAVVGVDSGPLHIAAALKKPGVAIYGPTDPAQTGPFKSSMLTLRVDAQTSYKRGMQIHPSMRAITPEQVNAALSLS